MKYITTLLFATLLTVHGMAQALAPTSIKGDLVIRFDTRSQLDGGKPKAGVTDKYKLNVTVSDTIAFDGTIEHLPFIKNMISNQAGILTHSIECIVINPKNPTQKRNIGRLYGTVPVDEKNVYRFEDGNLRIGIFGTGGAQGFESRTKGLALGKPPASEGIVDRIKKEAVSIKRQVGGKTIAVAVTKYDEMKFQGHVLSAGPVMTYPEVTVNGPMLYDYDRTAWYFNGVTVAYSVDGRMLQDRISGNIRWVEAANRNVSGEGEYQFDVRVNEPPPTEASMFAGAADEAAFFETNNAIPALTGTMKYKDTMTNALVTTSVVQINLTGNQLTKQQVMYLAKLLLMSAVVPINAE